MLESKIPGTWAYLTQMWLTLNTQHNSKGNRDATPSEFWQQVQAAWSTATPNRPIPSVGENALQRILQGFGNLLSAAALLDKRDEDCIPELMAMWKQEHPESWYGQVAKRQTEIQLFKGKLCIRDQGAEMEIADQIHGMNNPIRWKEIPRMKASKTLKSASLSPWMEVEEGMLLIILSQTPAAGTKYARAELR